MNINKLNAAIQESKLSKVQIAKECGVTRVTIDNALKGGDIRVSILETLAKVLGVSVGYFFDDDSSIHAIANGHYSIAAVGGNVNAGEIDVLKERIKCLEQLLDEKERLINVLLEGRK